MDTKRATVRSPGRPPALTEAQIERIRRALEAGLNISEIARVLRAPWSTVRDYVRRIEAEKSEEPHPSTGEAPKGPEAGPAISNPDDTTASATGSESPRGRDAA
jgi:hypothetical protein